MANALERSASSPGGGADPDRPTDFYRNGGESSIRTRPLYSALGIHGQYVTIDGPSGVVMALFSIHPVAETTARSESP